MAAAVQVGNGGGGGGGEGGIASQLVDKVTVMLGMHLQTSCFKDPLMIVDLCLSLARGIDHAVTNNEVPSKSQDLPLLLKQVYRCKNDSNLQAACMVLMMSVKSACQIGWFANREKDDLLRMARELGGCFSDTDSMRVEPTNAHPCIEKIMSRFYPLLKMDRILASFDVKSGYGVHVLDFHISMGMVAPEREAMWLFVARADDFDTSSCIVSPPEVNFLLNSMGVPGRTKIDMCNGPQHPTNVTTMLKYGVNLLQAIGNFNGNYIIAVAVMSLISSADPLLQDYVEPVSTTVDSDSEVIEMSSRISLNCPISLRRLKTPVKGHLCKHRQCFDFKNYLKINLRRPAWRCPHCNQSVCYTDIRIDRNIAKVLTEVEDNIADVIISADGSWKPIFESKEDSAHTNESTHVDHQKRPEQSETSCQTFLSPTAATTHVGPGVSNIHQIPSPPFQSSAASLSSHHLNTNSITTPLTHQEHGRTQAVSYSLQNQMFSSHSLQFQRPVYSSPVPSNEQWRFPPVDINRSFGGYPGAMWPPPSYPQNCAMWQPLRNLDPFMQTGPSFSTSPTILSFPQYDNHGMGTQLSPASGHVSGPSVPAGGSYPMQHHFMTQGIGGPVRNSGIHSTMFRLPSMQQTRHHPYNLQSHPPHPSNNYQNTAHVIPQARPHEFHRNGPTPANSTTQKAQSTTPSVPFKPTPSRPTPSRPNSSVHVSLPMISDRVKTLGEQQQNKATNGSPATQSETQGPTGRMRGSLRGEEANAYRQFILRPPQQAAARPAQPAFNQMPGVIPNSTSFNPASNVLGAQTWSAQMMNLPRSIGSLPERSWGTH